MLRKLLEIFLSSQVKVGPQTLQWLSDTWPIRKAARFTAYMYFRGKLAIEDKVKNKLSKSTLPPSNQILSRFLATFKQELSKGIEEAKRQEVKKRRGQ